MVDPAIIVRDVTLTYRLPHQRVSSLKEFAVRFAQRQVRYENLDALREVSFEVGRGEILAVVGANGAGKTTLMKVVGGVLPPSAGRVVVRGVLTAILDLGAGLNPDLTGFENIVLFEALLGRDVRRARARASEIAGWAGVSDYLDVPLRAYSNGMIARLAFAVVSDAEPEVLLMDEVLAVGDAEFQARCLDRVDALVHRGAAVILASHDVATTRQRATRAMWLDHGRIAAIGDPDRVVDSYVRAAALPVAL